MCRSSFSPMLLLKAELSNWHFPAGSCSYIHRKGFLGMSLPYCNSFMACLVTRNITNQAFTGSVWTPALATWEWAGSIGHRMTYETCMPLCPTTSCLIARLKATQQGTSGFPQQTYPFALILSLSCSNR